MQKTSSRLAWLTVVGAMFFGLAFSTASANAAETSAPTQNDGSCYPDGCATSTTSTTNPGPTCGVTLSAAKTGTEVVATVQHVPANGTVRIVLNGSTVGTGTNDPAAQGIRRAPAQTAEVSVAFNVPDLDPGVYSIVAVGDTFTVTCGGGQFEILASAVTTTGDSKKDGALAFTGLNILLFLLVAAGLVAAGYGMVRRSRRGQAHAA